MLNSFFPNGGFKKCAHVIYAGKSQWAFCPLEIYQKSRISFSDLEILYPEIPNSSDVTYPEAIRYFASIYTDYVILK